MKTIDRAGFMGAAAAATTAPALAQPSSTELGKPHPPLVAEDDPAITAAMIKLNRPDAAISAYTAMPKRVTPTTPGIVMAVHIWGLDAVMRDFVRRFAKLGYITIAPGLLDRSNPPSGDGVGYDGMKPFADAFGKVFTGNTAPGDLHAGYEWVRSKTPRGKIGIYGNCGGGTLVFQTIAADPSFAAAAVCYGSPRLDRASTMPPAPGSFDWTQKVSADVIGSYGGADKSNPVDMITEVYATFKPPHDLKVYPDAPHAYLDDTRDSYRPEAAADTWARMTAWYGKYLATG